MDLQENGVGPVTRNRAELAADADANINVEVVDTPAIDPSRPLPLLVSLPLSAATLTANDSSLTRDSSPISDSTLSANDIAPLPARKRSRSALIAPQPDKRLKPQVDEEISSTASAPFALPAVVPPPEKFTPKQLIVGTYYADSTSYFTVANDGFTFHFHIGKGSIRPVCLKYDAFSDYMICNSADLPVMIISSNLYFGEKVRKAIPTLRSSESSTMSSQIFDTRSVDRAHWYIIIEMNCVNKLVDLTCEILQRSTAQGGTGHLNLPKSITANEAKAKIRATKIVTLKWNELQLGSWKSHSVKDTTILVSGSRIKFKANKGENTSDVMLSINYGELHSVFISTDLRCPVMFVRTTESFGWSARERLGIPSTFQQGRDYYNPDSTETRFKFITFKLNPLGVTDETCQEIQKVCSDRRFHMERLSSSEAEDTLHKLLYQPIKCDSVRVGANELDELRAVTIHSDSLYICGCMLDSVVTMHLCIGDISEISYCTSEKLPVIFVKTSTAIRDTLKRNMAGRACEVFFDPNSADVRTQYIVLELAKATTKAEMNRVSAVIRDVLTKFAARPGMLKSQPVAALKPLTKKKSCDLLSAIKRPLQVKDCPCGKKVDVKRQEDVKQYLQSMVNKYSADALGKMAERVIDLEKKIICSVCLDNDCQVAFSCGHTICERCDLNLRKCHICRSKIIRRVKIFL